MTARMGAAVSLSARPMVDMLTVRGVRPAMLGALFNHWGVMAPVLWVLAALSTITVAHRIQYTYSKTKHLAPIA